MFLKPASGQFVTDPDHNDVLPADGRNVEPHQYWLRRIEDGDVFEATPPVDVPVKAETEKKDKG
jgi:hypothetical protein